MSETDSPLVRRIARTLRRASAFAFVERLWPRLVLAGSVLGVFLSISWLGLWPLIPDLLRLALVAVLALALIACLIWAARTPRATRGQSLSRVERASGLEGRPLAALSDAPFDTTSPQGKALWQAHQERMAARVQRLAAGAPQPRTERLDRWALRAPVLLVLVVAFFVAGPQRFERIEEAFAPIQSAPGVPVRIDVWATPPAYTGLPPRTLLADGSLDAESAAPSGVMLPAGSRLTILLSDPESIAARLTAQDDGVDIALAASADEAGSFEASLDGDAVLELSGRRGAITIAMLITPDTPPSIRFAEAPEATPLGALTLRYQAQDDYAVESAHAEVEPADERFTDAVTLVDPPRIDLILPQARSSEMVETTRDLSAHPWAGLAVDMTLVATDGAGQEATSRTLTTTLPMRTFREELARALVEQRRLLAVDTRTRTQVLTALEGLALAPDQFMADELSTFLALTVTTQRLRLADSREDLLGVVEMLWQLALQVEDGDVSLAAERLREAEENLADALENGASSEEIAALMDELREAFQEYMQALAERFRDQDMAQMPMDMPMTNLNPLAMQDMMDQIEDLAELGAADAARELLDQLRQQLDQLRGAQAMQQREPSPQEQQLRESMQELQAITREQQRLLDDTFPFSSEAQRSEVMPQGEGEQGMQNGQTDRPQANPGEDSSEALQALGEDQRNLQDQLEGLMDQLRDLGLDPERFGEAAEAMEGAGDMLLEGDSTTALGEQGRALEALRDGAQDMMEQLAQGEGQGGEGQAQGPGQGMGPGQPRITFGPGSNGPRGTDPLGRPQRESGGQNADGTVRIPEESDIQRARDILNEIQRRLGEQIRPQAERDYLDRLIDRF